jgi:hypothetical protein
MALNNVGTLRARMGLDSSQFNRGLDTARGRVRKFAATIGRSMALAGVAMAGAAAAGVGALTRSSLTFVDQQAKLARSIDGSIDALRALQLAGNDAGVSSDTLNASMQKLGTKLVEANVKGGASAKALDRMGLSAKNLLALDVDERLATIADRAKELGWSATKTSQFLLEMGVESKEMALLVAQGGDAIRAARQEVKDLGLSLSAVDAAKVEVANDAMSRIKLTTEALGNRMAVTLAPALKAMADSFTASSREGGGFRAVIEHISERVSTAVMTFRDLFSIGSSIVDSFKNMQSEGGRLSIISDVVSGVINTIRTFWRYVGEAITVVGHLSRTTGNFGEVLSALGPLASEVWQRIGDGADYIRSAVAVMTNKMSAIFYGGLRSMAGGFFEFTATVARGLNRIFGTELEGITAGITRELGRSEMAALSAADAHSISMGRFKKSIGAPLVELEKLRASVAAVGETATTNLAEGAAAADDLNSSLADVGSGGAASAANGIDKVGKSLKDAKEKGNDAESAFRGFFTSTVTRANTLGEAIRNLASRFADLLANKAFDVLWGNFTGSGSGSSGGGVFGGLGKALKSLISFDGGGYTGSGTRAGGLDGLGGFPAMLHPNETVIDHTKQGGMAGSGRAQSLNVTVTMDRSTGSIGAFVRDAAGKMIAEAVPGIQQRTLAAVPAYVSNHGRRFE